MSNTENGMASNSTKQPTESPGKPTPAVEQPAQNAQDELAGACLAIVQHYRTAEISKAQATIELYSAFPNTLNQDTFIVTYGSYISMLDNVDRFRDGAGRQAPVAGLSGAGQDPSCKGNSHSQAPTCLVSFIIPLLFSYFTLRLPISHSLSLFFYFLAWYHDPLCSFMSYHVPLPLVITMDSFHLSIPYIPTASTLFYICLYYVSTSP